MNNSPALYASRPGDYLLAALIVAGCAFALFAARLPAVHSTPQAVVYVDGVRRLTLRLDANRTLPQVFGERHLTLQTEPGRIRVSAADCPRQDCVRQGWIARPARTLVCLPAHVVIRIEGRESAEDVDAISE